MKRWAISPPQPGPLARPDDSTYFKNRRKAEMSTRRMSQVIQAKVMFIEKKNIQKTFWKLGIIANNFETTFIQIWNNFETNWDNFRTIWYNFEHFETTWGQLWENFRTTWRQLWNPMAATKWLSTELTSAQWAVYCNFQIEVRGENPNLIKNKA